MRIHKQILAGALVAASVGFGRALPAQGSVAGQVQIREKGGDETEDLANVVVYLEPAP